MQWVWIPSSPWQEQNEADLMMAAQAQAWLCDSIPGDVRHHVGGVDLATWRDGTRRNLSAVHTLTRLPE